ncbi:hypothetical protein DCC62_17890 [candidate division KSB1 bacterium]|nr:MAG: hypothetical protein DCC62_17890 [candidate division KSB1 bacterium]
MQMILTNYALFGQIFKRFYILIPGSIIIGVEKTLNFVTLEFTCLNFYIFNADDFFQDSNWSLDV